MIFFLIQGKSNGLRALGTVTTVSENDSETNRTEHFSSCFKPSQPQRIISGLTETSIRRYIVERTSKAEIKPEEQGDKAESCRGDVWNEIQLKGP